MTILLPTLELVVPYSHNFTSTNSLYKKPRKTAHLAPLKSSAAWKFYSAGSTQHPPSCQTTWAPTPSEAPGKSIPFLPPHTNTLQIHLHHPITNLLRLLHQQPMPRRQYNMSLQRPTRRRPRHWTQPRRAIQRRFLSSKCEVCCRAVVDVCSAVADVPGAL